MSRFVYSLLQFVPAHGREEAVNLGVIVVSDADHESRGRFLYGYRQKIGAVAPGANFAQITNAVRTLRRRFGRVHQPTIFGESDPRITTAVELRALTSGMSGQLQLTEPRYYTAGNIESAGDELFDSMVVPLGRERSPQRAMTRTQVRGLIARTIKEWSGNVIVEEGEEDGHYADFWIKGGVPERPIAALVAIPEDPADRREAMLLCDSIPTIVHIYRESNPEFRAIAVLPPGGRIQTEFLKEAEKRLKAHPGIVVTHSDKLAEHVDELLLRALIRT